MKQKVKIILTILLLVSGSLQSTTVQASEKKVKERLAVLDLEAKYGIDKGLAEALSGIIRDKLHNFGEYQVMSKEDIQAVASREQLMKAMGCDDVGSQCLVDFGRTIGTRYMVAGNISKLGSTYTISLRMLDTQGESAGVSNRVSESCKCSEDALIGMAQNVAATLVGKKNTSARTEEEARRPTEDRRKTDEKKQILPTESDKLKKEMEKTTLESVRKPIEGNNPEPKPIFLVTDKEDTIRFFDLEFSYGPSGYINAPIESVNFICFTYAPKQDRVVFDAQEVKIPITELQELIQRDNTEGDEMVKIVKTNGTIIRLIMKDNPFRFQYEEYDRKGDKINEHEVDKWGFSHGEFRGTKCRLYEVKGRAISKSGKEGGISFRWESIKSIKRVNE